MSPNILALEKAQPLSSTMFEGHRNSPFSIHILTCSIFSIVLATRVNRPELDKELSRDCKSQAPLASALAAAHRALVHLRGRDSLATGGMSSVFAYEKREADGPQLSGIWHGYICLLI